MGAISVGDVIGIATGGGALGILGTWLQQRNRRQDRHDEAVLAGSTAAATMATTAIGQWQQIVAAQSTINAEHLAEINDLRRRANECERREREQTVELAKLRNDLRMYRAQVIEERRVDE